MEVTKTVTNDWIVTTWTIWDIFFRWIYQLGASECEFVIHATALRASGTIHCRVIRINISAFRAAKHIVICSFGFESSASDLCIKNAKKNASEQNWYVGKDPFTECADIHLTSISWLEFVFWLVWGGACCHCISSSPHWGFSDAGWRGFCMGWNLSRFVILTACFRKFFWYCSC